METLAQRMLIDRLRAIAGRRHVLTRPADTRAFANGYRYGGGPVLAVVRPATPLEQFEVFAACIAADVIVIAQAANTGLTGGSTPLGSYDRPVVVINTMRIRGIHLVQNGKQAICLAGATLYDLERQLAPLAREPHSVIGSSCIGASVVGGICNNSGGALIRRGPAYTELALYARADEAGRVELVNHLGVALGDDPQVALTRLWHGGFTEEMVEAGSARASTPDYEARVRDVQADSPARYNADPSRLFEASGSAGKVMVLAVRLDTFPKDERTVTYYIGTNDPDEVDVLRRRLLTQGGGLPVSGEYIHRDAFNIAEVYGKDVFVAIERFGTDRLPVFFAAKRMIDRLTQRIGLVSASVSDRLLQMASRLLPQHLPTRMLEWRDRFEHHLILKMAGEDADQTGAILSQLFSEGTGAYFECTTAEAGKAFLQRFAVAGAAIRYRAIHAKRVGEIIALDIALRRNDREWRERLPDDIMENIDTALYYGHFFCHVFHQDYVLKPGVDPVALEHKMWEILDQRGAKYPAEHNVGQLYPAAQSLIDHYRSLDPGNRLNPGIGQTSRKRCWH